MTHAPGTFPPTGPANGTFPATFSEFPGPGVKVFALFIASLTPVAMIPMTIMIIKNIAAPKRSQFVPLLFSSWGEPATIYT